MQRIDLSDFSGGLSEQYNAEGFTNRQWSKLKGFVIDSDFSIRSQWPIQQVGSSTPSGTVPNVKAVNGFVGATATFLVAIDTAGYIWTATAPADTATNTTTTALSWTKQSAITANTDYRFITQILVSVTGLGEVNALLLHSVSGTAPAVAIYEGSSGITYKTWDRFYPVDQPAISDTAAVTFSATTSQTQIATFTDRTAPWTVQNNGAYPVNIYLSTGLSTIIATIQPLDSYTHTAALATGVTLYATAVGGTTSLLVGVLLATYPNPRKNVMPRANIGTMWRNRLILGDINQRIDSTLSWETSGNIQRSPYAYYYSEVYPDWFHEQSILYAGSGESQLLGLHVLDDYLISITSPATNTDGLRTTRGSLDYVSLQSGTTTLQVNVLRGGVGPTRSLSTTGNRVASCVWPEGGIVALLDHLGGVWYTDGIEIDRLDRTGPKIVDSTSATDEIASLGRYLFVKRGDRVLVLNMISGVRGQSASAAWTEVALKNGDTAANISSLAPVDANMFFVYTSGGVGTVHRFAMARDNDADTERGSWATTQLSLTFATPTLADQNHHQRVNWYKFGIRARGRANNSTLVSMKVNNGPALSTTNKIYSLTLNRTLVGRNETVIPAGIGSTTEASGEVVIKGDVTLEAVTFWSTGGKASAPVDGSDGD